MNNPFKGLERVIEDLGPKAKESFWARDLRPGAKLRSTFLATDAAVRTDSRGTPYLSLKLVDKTGSVDARMWRLPRELFEHMVADEELWGAFRTAPAAKSMHHARVGGLLEHSVQCLRVARTLAEIYPVNRDLLLFGAIFHDVGKTQELSWEGGSFAYTTPGRLQGHVILGDRIVAAKVAEVSGFPDELTLQLSHVMLSH